MDAKQRPGFQSRNSGKDNQPRINADFHGSVGARRARLPQQQTARIGTEGMAPPGCERHGREGEEPSKRERASQSADTFRLPAFLLS